jgi:hypothetical protein
LPRTRTFTLLPPLVSFFASTAPLLSGSLAVVSRPVEGLGMPQSDVQSSGRDASWLLARFTSCRDNEIPTAVQVRSGRCTGVHSCYCEHTHFIAAQNELVGILGVTRKDRPRQQLPRAHTSQHSRDKFTFRSYNKFTSQHSSEPTAAPRTF